MVARVSVLVVAQESSQVPEEEFSSAGVESQLELRSHGAVSSHDMEAW